jgi:hypothetical protein
LFGSYRLQHIIPTMRAAFVLCTFVVAAASSSQQQALEPLTKYRRMSFAWIMQPALLRFCAEARHTERQQTVHGIMLLLGARSSSAVLSRFTFEVGCVRRPMSTIRKLSQYRLKNCAGLGSSSVSVFV